MVTPFSPNRAFDQSRRVRKIITPDDARTGFRNYRNQDEGFHGFRKLNEHIRDWCGKLLGTDMWESLWILPFAGSDERDDSHVANISFVRGFLQGKEFRGFTDALEGDLWFPVTRTAFCRMHVDWSTQNWDIRGNLTARFQDVDLPSQAYQRATIFWTFGMCMHHDRVKERLLSALYCLQAFTRVPHCPAELRNLDEVLRIAGALSQPSVVEWLTKCEPPFISNERISELCDLLECTPAQRRSALRWWESKEKWKDEGFCSFPPVVSATFRARYTVSDCGDARWQKCEEIIHIPERALVPLMELADDEEAVDAEGVRELYARHYPFWAALESHAQQWQELSALAEAFAKESTSDP